MLFEILLISLFQISAEIHEELKTANFASIVSVCRNGKLPFQGSLFVLRLIMKKIKSPLPIGKCIYNVRHSSVALLVDVFKLVLQMKSSRNKHVQKAYSDFSNDMFQVESSTVTVRIQLLISDQLIHSEVTRIIL